MKRCPECRRDYYDDSLLYCLDDGAELLEGPASTDEPATAILHRSPGPSEASTRFEHVSHGTQGRDRIDRTEDVNSAADSPHRMVGGSARRPLYVGLAVLSFLIAIVIFFGYRYFVPDAAKQIESIAVMPFVNESADPEVEYLSDGMTETLIRSLSKLPNLNVKPRSSVFRYKGKEIDVQSVASELGVQAVLTGRIDQRGNDLTLYVELIDAALNKVVWSEQYNRKQSEIVSLQSEIGRDFAARLTTQLSGSDEEKVTKISTLNHEAYQLYLRGRFHRNKRSGAELQKAIEYFQAAVATDARYALAYAGLAESYALMPFYSDTKPKDALPRAHDFALKALSLDENLAEAHAALGLILDDYFYDFAGAEKSYKRALQISPENLSARQWYSELLTHLGRHDEAIVEIREALTSDPLSLTVNKGYGDALYFARGYDESIVQLKKTLELDASFALPHRVLGFIYEMKGDHPKAIDHFARFQELSGRPEAAETIRKSFAEAGWTGYLRTLVRADRVGNMASYMAARVYAALGEKEAAFSKLNEAYENREFFLVLLKVDPSLDPLRDDPRFSDLLTRIGLPE